MNLIKRLTTSVTATLENAVGELENHDAIVEANIKQTRQAVAKTQARLATLRQQRNAIETQLKTANEQVALWEKRAISIGDENEHQALQCLSRRNHSETEAHRLSSTLDQQDDLIGNVNSNLETLKSKLDEMSQRHNLMRSRQAVASVQSVASKVGQSEQINDTFERWEAAVLETELGASQGCSVDPLEEQFRSQESDKKLHAQLADLKNTCDKSSSASDQTKS